MDLVSLGDYIKQRRTGLGLTQAQLSEGICDTTTVSRIERGEQDPRHNTVIALLERLGAPYDRYFTLLSKDCEGRSPPPASSSSREKNLSGPKLMNMLWRSLKSLSAPESSTTTSPYSTSRVPGQVCVPWRVRFLQKMR